MTQRYDKSAHPRFITLTIFAWCISLSCPFFCWFMRGVKDFKEGKTLVKWWKPYSKLYKAMVTRATKAFFFFYNRGKDGNRFWQLNENHNEVARRQTQKHRNNFKDVTRRANKINEEKKKSHPYISAKLMWIQFLMSRNALGGLGLSFTSTLSCLEFLSCKVQETFVNGKGSGSFVVRISIL